MKELQEMEPPVPQEEIEVETDAPVEAAESEVKAEEPKQEEKKEEEKQTLVPHGALHEERERRKQAQREFEEYKRRDAQEKAVLQDRLTQLFQIAQQNQQPQIRDPQKDPDPLEAMQHNQQLTLQQLADLQKRVATEDWQRKEAQKLQELVGWAQVQANEFRAETPDFDEAYQHVRAGRYAELDAMGYAPHQIAQILQNDEMWVFQHAAQTGRNPAEVVYKIAKAKGFQKKVEKPVAEQKMETLQKGTQAAKTLGSGGAPAGTPTPEQIAAMDDDAFEQLKADLRRKGKRISDII